MYNENVASKTKIFLIAMILASTFFLIFRSLGLYPTVFIDEYSYSRLARLGSLREAYLPGYLYFALYRATSSCGEGFLGCARLFNVIFFVSAAPFIYFAGRKVTGDKTALVITALSLLSPINTYTAYFMPESLYFLSFWVFTWLVLSINQKHGIWHWFFLGAFLGLTSLIKPHALFLLPALAVLFLISLRRDMAGEASTRSFKLSATFFVSAIATKLFIGFILAGKAGLTFFGQSYTSIASASMADSNRYIDLARLAFENLQGHLLGLAILFSVPVAQLLWSSKYFFLRPAGQSVALNTLYTSLVLMVLVTTVAFFTASVSSTDPSQTNTRLHMRYYNFAFPLLLIVGASQISLGAIQNSLKWRAIAAFPIGAAILRAIYTHLAPYTPNFVDNPELRGFTFDSTVFYVLSGISLFSLVLWVYAAQAGAKIFLYLFMPLSVAFSTFYVNQELRQRLIPDVYDKAGIFTKHYLSHEEISKLVVVGSEPAALYRSLFYLDNPQASLETIPKGGGYDLSKIPPDKDWVLVIGDHSLPENTFFQLLMNGFTLARVTGTSTVDFKKSAWPGVISRARGLSSAEAWGTWSSGDVVTLEFSMPLPEKFAVHLVANAFGPNVGKEFVAHVGDSAIRFTLGASPEERVLEFSNPKRSRTIKIDIPSPASPKELGLSDDERSLGIAFTELRITPL